jgi:hypothetical protein
MTTKNTDLVANFEAIPQVANNAAAAGDSTDDDIVMLAPIPSNAAVPQLFVGSDDIRWFVYIQCRYL